MIRSQLKYLLLSGLVLVGVEASWAAPFSAINEGGVWRISNRVAAIFPTSTYFIDQNEANDFASILSAGRPAVAPVWIERGPGGGGESYEIEGWQVYMPSGNTVWRPLASRSTAEALASNLGRQQATVVDDSRVIKASERGIEFERRFRVISGVGVVSWSYYDYETAQKICAEENSR